MSHWFSSLLCIQRLSWTRAINHIIWQIEKASVKRSSLPSTHIFSQLACLLEIFSQAVRWPYLSKGTFSWGWEQSKHKINIGTIPKHDVLNNQAFRELISTFYDYFISEKIAPIWSLTGLLSPLQWFLVMILMTIYHKLTKGKNKHMLEMVICYNTFCRKIIDLSFSCIVVKQMGSIKLNT